MIAIHRMMKNNRYFLLLLSLIVFFVGSAIIADYRENFFLFALFFAIVLWFSVYIIEHNKWLLVTGVIFAIIIVIGNYYNFSIHHQRNVYFIVIEQAITIIFFATITGVTLSSILWDKAISTSTLYGAICSYLLIGLTWSFIYMLITQLNPEAFQYPTTVNFVDNDKQFQDFIYYSFVTLSTLGYGDITPVSYIAKTSAWLESVIGQIYLTVWIARLVGLSIANKTSSSGSDQVK